MRKIIVFIIGMMFASHGSAQTWVHKKDVPATPDGAALFVAGGKIYYGGGLYGNNIYEYDPAADSWTLKTTMPGALTTCRSGAQCFTINDTAYVGFGYDVIPATQSETDLIDLWRYNQTSNTWTQRASFPISVGYLPTNIFVINGKAYMAGGNDNSSASDQLWQYDPEMDQWTRKKDLIDASHSALAFSLGNKGYIAFCSPDTGYNSCVYEYDAPSDTWTKKNDLPAIRRQGGAAFVCGGVAFAGLGSYYNGSVLVYNDIYAYDPVHDSWSQMANAPLMGTYVSENVSLGNDVYIGIGKDIAANTILNEWYKISSPATGIRNVSKIKTLTCFPNPAKDELCITGLPEDKTTGVCKITDVAGHTVKTVQMNNSMINIDGLLPGHYFAELNADGETFLAHFDKQ